MTHGPYNVDDAMLYSGSRRLRRDGHRLIRVGGRGSQEGNQWQT